MLFKSAIVFAGCFLIACGVNFFLIPFHILDGGVIGLSLIANYLWGLRVGAGWLLFSLPIFVLAWFFNRSYFYSSIHGLWLSALLMDVLAPFQYFFVYYIELSPLTSALFGGFIIGTGFGIMLRQRTSTGGTDLLAHFISVRTPLNVGLIIAVLDVAIISLGGLLFNGDTFLLSAVTVTAGGLATGLITLNKSG